MHEVADAKRSSAAVLIEQSLNRLKQDVQAWQRRSQELDDQPDTPSKARQRQLLQMEYRRLEKRRQRLGECRSIAR